MLPSKRHWCLKKRIDRNEAAVHMFFRMASRPDRGTSWTTFITLATTCRVVATWLQKNVRYADVQSLRIHPLMTKCRLLADTQSIIQALGWRFQICPGFQKTIQILRKACVWVWKAAAWCGLKAKTERKRRTFSWLGVSSVHSNVDSKKIKGYRISLELSTVIFTVTVVWFTDEVKKGIDVSDQWRITTNSQKASVYIIVMNRDVVNVVKCH